MVEVLIHVVLPVLLVFLFLAKFFPEMPPFTVSGGRIRRDWFEPVWFCGLLARVSVTISLLFPCIKWYLDYYGVLR